MNARKLLALVPGLAGRVVYILDFSFSADILRGIEERAAKLVMLDHHKSAAEKLTGFACRCGVVHFDMDKCGARLAWEFFHPATPLPDLVRYIEDRDIWVWRHPESPAFLAALDMEPHDFARWAAIAAFSPEQVAAFMARGQAMDEKFSKLAAGIAENAQPVTFNGQHGLMVNAPGVFHSLVGDLLSRQSGTFALMWTVASPFWARLSDRLGRKAVLLFGMVSMSRLQVTLLPDLSYPTLTIRTELPGVVIVEPKVFRDERGFFAETYQKEKFAAGGIDAVFVQDNHVASTRGVLRGMHLQLRRTQGKLVRAIEGRIWDVALDVRKGSPAYGFWVGVELSAENFKQLYVPPGYCVLSEKAQVEYKVTDFYDPQSELVIRFDDPEAGIEWPVKDPILSKRDAAGKTLAELDANLRDAYRLVLKDRQPVRRRGVRRRPLALAV